MMKSPFLDEELLSAEPRPDFDPTVERLAKENPFLQGLTEASVNLAASGEEYYVDQSPPGDAQEFKEGYDEERGDVEYDLSTDVSPLNALSPSELKAVRITSTFETGRAGSFGGLTGNFDGQGVSFGLMNFAWKAGSLVTLLKEFLRYHPAAFAEVFGPDAARFQEIVSATRPDPENPRREVRDLERQMEFARNVLNDANNKIREPWRGYFGRLESNSGFKRIQVKAVRRAAQRARHWCHYFGLKTERGFAFMFDLVSSHGGGWLNADKFKGRRRALLRAMLEKKKAEVGRTTLSEIEKLEVIANLIADVSGEGWRDKVRARKLWFVKGSGKVHDTFWDLAKDFGVTDAPTDFGTEAGLKELVTHELDEGEGVELSEPYIDESEPEEDENLATEGSDEYLSEPSEEAPLNEGNEESEALLTSEDEAPYNEEEGEIAYQPETQVCSPYVHEEELGESEGDSDKPYADEEEEETGLELEGFEMLPGVAYAARIVNNRARTGSTPAEVALIVDRWGTADATKVSGARLKVYECDTSEPGRSDAPTANDVQMAEFTLDLEPNPEFVKNPAKTAIPHMAVANAKWANAKLEKSYRATKKPDVILWLGSKAFHLWIPRQDILEEGSETEIGFTLEDGAGHKVERMSIAQGHVASVSIPDYLKVMLEIPGRFDDPKRDASVEMDGVKFDEFLNGKNRREFITQWLNEHPALKEAANEPNADLKTSDIIKGWFIIHDVGAKATLKDRRFKANQPKTKGGAVHGFLNRAGYYAATHDFTKNKQGTVYEFLSKNGKKYVNEHTINIETVPDVESDVPDKSDGSRGDPSSADQYASTGYSRKGKKVTYYKWTKAAIDVLADLYIFASVRARHLLTITVHKETDRNLGRSVIWREYSAAEIRAGTGKHWDKVRDHPDDYHGDPNGFNMQALYDVITQKLNALGGKQMPVGARYGIHPRRVCKADGQDIVNGSNQLHEFPHQSDPNVKPDAGLKKAGWWNS